MTDKELDERVSNLSDEDLTSLASGQGEAQWELMWYRPRILVMKMADELLELRRIVRADKDVDVQAALDFGKTVDQHLK
jgi:hypothetical protein